MDVKICHIYKRNFIYNLVGESILANPVVLSLVRFLLPILPSEHIFPQKLQCMMDFDIQPFRSPYPFETAI